MFCLEIPAMVVVDGEFLPDKPRELVARGDYKTDVNILFDTVKDEGSFMLFLASPKFRQTNPEDLSLEEAKEIFYQMLTHNVGSEQYIPKDTIDKLYFDKFNAHHDHPNLFRQQVGIALGDYVLGCATIDFAKQVYKNSGGKARVYQWYFTSKLGRKKFLNSDWGVTGHTDDIYPVFGNPLKNPEWYDPRERDISREVIDFIKSFVRNG